MSEETDPRALSESYKDLSTLVASCPGMSFDEFDLAIASDANQWALGVMRDRAKVFEEPESVETLLALMLVHVSRFTPGYDKLLPLVEQARRDLDARASRR